MLEILNAALSLPTVLFTALLGGVVLFWLAVILGGLDHNIFNADADVDMDLPGDVPDAGDLHPHAETEAHGLDAGGSGWTGGLLGFLNLGMVPVSIIASLAIFAGWTGSMLLELYLQPVLGTLLPGFVTGTGFLLLAGSGGLFASGLLTRPLRGVFKVQTQHGGAALIGKIVMIGTEKVNASFGQAELKQGGAPLLLSVRCRERNELRKGKVAVLVAYDEATDTYEVTEPAPERARVLKSIEEHPEEAETFIPADSGKEDQL